MLIEEIVKILGVEKLDEAQQTSIKEKIDTIIDVKARERADSLLSEETERLITEYEEKFEDYKKDITSKFSNFVDSVLDEELVIPEKIVEYARKGELYDDLVEQFKIRLTIDEGVLNDEVKDLLKEAKDEITSLKSQLNEKIKINEELGTDVKQMAANLYLRKKCDGLTEQQRTKVINILGDILDKKEIDRKFDILVEGILNDELEKGAQEPTAEADTETIICKACGAVYKVKEVNISEPCPKCGGSFEEIVDSVEDTEENGQGNIEVNNQKGSDINLDIDTLENKVNEDSSFENIKKRWLKILKENKI